MSVSQSERTLSNFLAYLDGLRARGGVHFDEKIKAWHVLGYHDTQQVQTDPVTFSSEVAPLAPKQEDFELSNKGNFVRADDPEHRRLRGLVSKAFTPKMIADLEPRIAELATQLLDAADARGGRWDFIKELGHPLPFLVMTELLGIPEDDRAFIRNLSDRFVEVQSYDAEESLDGQKENAANNVAPLLHELNQYLLDILRARRENPSDDLAGRLMTVEADGARLDEEEALGFLNLLVAGHHTTTATLGNTVLALGENPHGWDQLRADPALIPAAIEESVRFRPPFPRSARQTTKDTELGGRHIPAGAVVLVWLTAANRDDRVFADPNRFDILRKPNPHLSFGKGIHHCLGAPLARLETRTVIRLMLERYRDIRVRDDAPVTLRNPWQMIGVSKLPIEVRPY
ncbi:cytochrome P450 [Streptomyces rubradiris]|uniref:Cytochrome P450 n=1 Tax=Streptomyces rubradiris TaxID=285531 RepID=Q2PC42_STRRR|nr:cytochrome P450 [Streptomyces rubradiris]GHH30428.1 cytochrome P450 [Streptomyces rubradiris]GHI58174.1 cytochrome P450 [Streptomyces rubradiris]CAI94726.1 putative cytochrome P450 [Streptomyces rubradiris]